MSGEEFLGLRVFLLILCGYSLTPFAGLGFFWLFNDPNPERRIPGALLGFGSLLAGMGLAIYALWPLLTMQLHY